MWGFEMGQTLAWKKDGWSSRNSPGWVLNLIAHWSAEQFSFTWSFLIRLSLFVDLQREGCFFFKKKKDKWWSKEKGPTCGGRFLDLGTMNRKGIFHSGSTRLAIDNCMQIKNSHLHIQMGHSNITQFYRIEIYKFVGRIPIYTKQVQSAAWQNFCYNIGASTITPKFTARVFQWVKNLLQNQMAFSRNYSFEFLIIAQLIKSGSDPFSFFKLNFHEDP